LRAGALLAVILLVGGLAAPPALAIWPFPKREAALPDPIQKPRAAAAAFLSRAIRVVTVNPPGSERPLAELYLKWLRDAHIEAQLIETPGAASGPGRAAVWARVPGNGSRAPLILLSHLDVVPADSEGWAIDPFAGAVVGGYVVGRGALDAKGVGIVHLIAMIELAHRAVPLDRDVIFLATPDEETGGREGAAFLIQRRPELLAGAEFLLTEGGGILVGEAGAPNIWGVTVSEKAPCWLRLATEGPGGHASSAGSNGAVPRLVAALARLDSLSDSAPLRVTPEVARMFRQLAPLAASNDRAGYANLANGLESDPDFRRRFLHHGPRAALVRNTAALTVLRAGSSTNVVPTQAYAEIDARLLPGERCVDFLHRVRAEIDDPGISISVKLAFESNGSPAETELFDAIASVAAERDPGSFVIPRVIAGFTDAHYFRELGIVAYGFVPRWLPASETRGVHGPNERISVDNLERGVDTLVEIVEVLGAPQSGVQ